MPITFPTNTTQPKLIQVGPGMLWINVEKPADAVTLQVSGQPSGSWDQRVYGPVPVVSGVRQVGTFVGAAIGESRFRYVTRFVDIAIETSTAKVEKVLNEEEAHCDFNIAELTAENIGNTLPIATVSTAADVLLSGQTVHKAVIGGLRLVTPTTIAFISPNRRISETGTTIFSYVFCGYNAINAAGFDGPFSRGKETVWKIDYELIADTARTVGDQLAQIAVRQSS